MGNDRMDISHLTINIVMALSIIGGALVMGIRLGELREMIRDMRVDLVEVKKIPLLEKGLELVKEVAARTSSDHNQLARKVARIQGESTGRWHAVPDSNGEDHD